MAGRYLRESKAQYGERAGVSLLGQETTISVAIERSGIADSGMIWTDQVSGRAIRDLVGLDACLAAYMRRGSALTDLFVETADRLGRNELEVQTRFDAFRRAKITVWNAQNVEITHASLAILSSAAEYESVTEGDRMSRAIRNKMQAGRALGRRIYGFYIDEDDRYQIDEAEAAAVRLCHGMYAEGLTISAILRQLAADGHPPPRRIDADGNAIGGEPRWRAYQVLRRRSIDGIHVQEGILARKAYAGLRITGLLRHKWGEDGSRLVEAHLEGEITVAMPAIVNVEVEAMVRARVDGLNPGLRSVFRRSAYILDPVLCGACGAPMTLSNGQNLKCRPWERTAVLVCEAYDAGVCGNDRGLEMGALQLGVAQATAVFMARFDTEAVFVSAWRRTVEGAARCSGSASLEDIREAVAAVEAKLGRLVRHNAQHATEATRRALEDAAIEKTALDVALLQAGRDRASSPMVPDRRAASEALSTFLQKLPRRIDEVVDPEERSAYEALRGFYTSVKAVSAGSGRFRIEVDTVVGPFACTAWVRFIPLGRLSSALLTALQSAGGMPLDGERLRAAAEACGHARNRMARGLDRLLELKFAERVGNAYRATGRKPLDIGGKSAFVVIDW